jgi:LSD1 subclass zinc finger protein
MSILDAWDNPPQRNRERIIKEAKWWSTAHCPDDGTNLKYSPGDTETRCTLCGQALSLVPIKWSGQK